MCRTYVSFFAGIFKQSLFKYCFYSLLGIAGWNTLLIVLGYCLASRWFVIEKYYKNYKFVFIALILLLLIIFLICKMYKKRKKTKTINGD